jgi:hypothetical protein
LFWRASHGHAIPEEAWPAVLFARWIIGEPYSWMRMLASLTQQFTPEGAENTEKNDEA